MPERFGWPLLLLCACGPTTTSGGQEGGGSVGGTTSTTTGSSVSGPVDTSTTQVADTSSSTTEASPGVCPPPGQTFEQTSEPCRGVHSYGIACCGADAYPPCPGPGHDGNCVVDADCDDDLRGTCRSSTVLGNMVCRCFYDACVTDSDCDTGDACLCAADPSVENIEVARCVASDCRTDADCAGFRCALSGRACSLAYELHCHTAEDECGSDADCQDGTFCGFAPDSTRWVCTSPGPPCD